MKRNVRKKMNQARPVRRPGVAPRGRGWNAVINALLLLGVWLTGVLMLNLGGPRRHVGLAEGQRAPATVVAAVDFDCDNLAATELVRRQASEAVVPVFSIQMGPLQAAWRTMDKLAGRAVTLRQDIEKALAQGTDGPIPDAAAAEARLESGLAVAADLLGVMVPGSELVQLFPAGKEMDSLAALKESLQSVWMAGVLSDLGRESKFQGLAPAGVIDLLNHTGEDDVAFRTVELANLASVAEAMTAYVQEAQRRLETLEIDSTSRAIEELARPSMQANLDYNPRPTEERRAAARRKVPPSVMTVRTGTTLMEEGDTVTAQTVIMIEAYNRRMIALESPQDRRLKRLGDSALLLIVLGMCAAWLHGSQPGAYAKLRRKLYLTALGLLALVLATLYRHVSAGLNWIPPWLVPFAMPIALPAVLAVLIMGPRYALVVGLWGAVSTALIFDRSFELLLLGLGSSTLAALMLRHVRKRAQVMRAGLALGGFEVVLALTMTAMIRHLPATFLTQMSVGLASGIFTAVLALLLLPVMEWMSGHTTDITLLELTDMGHPLLQRLAMEAPGTYHHCLLVGAIGQAAANRIGANGLLVHVCANYHDIGKLSKPEFFSENQRGGENPHDNLAPSMSVLVIQSHVKEGLTLAKRYKLPRPICEGIASHHGTTLTSYFYQLARRAQQEAGLVEDSGLEASFRYDGPRPWTRELAVLMLADTVEAASRSLEKPTPNRIGEMVDTLMRDKLLDGQLDLCPITLEDLHDIRESFVFSLSNILHGRSPYPREDQPAQPAASVASASGGTPPPVPGPSAPGLSG